jgi:PIN domain nuclease of toxin-antitoxin system
MVVLDTSALLFWLFAPERLSANAAQAIAAATQIVISSISIWEIGIKVQRGKLELPLSPEVLVARLNETRGVRIEPVTEKTWLQNLALTWDHKDPADRIIIATAVLLNCPLLTSDLEIRAFYPAAVW